MLSRLLRQTVDIARLCASVSRRRPRLVYELLSDRQLMGDRTLYINLGYWERATDLDTASEHLAQRLAEKAGLCPGDEVLDVGCGFGDQDIFWMRTAVPRRILGVNVTPSQVAVANARAARAGMAGRVRHIMGDGARLGIGSGRFDKVMALESAFHFYTRDRFFAEAWRVLRPGGVLATADFVLREPRSRRALRRTVARELGTRAWQIPTVNLYGAERYVEGLDRCGYQDIDVERISDRVFEPFVAFQRPRFDTTSFRARFDTLVRLAAKTQIDLGFLDELEYILVTARKPLRAQARGLPA